MIVIYEKRTIRMLTFEILANNSQKHKNQSWVKPDVPQTRSFKEEEETAGEVGWLDWQKKI